MARCTPRLPLAILFHSFNIVARVLLSLSILCALASCAPVYFPNTPNVPLHREKGEFQASARIGNGFELQSAYAISNNWGVMANTNFLLNKSKENYRSLLFGEGGVGYFENLDHLVLECYAGAGLGASESQGDFTINGTTSTTRGNGTFYKVFIQPSLGGNRSAFTAYLTPRVSLIDFVSLKTSSSGPVQTSPTLFFEPNVGFRFSSDNVSAIFNTGLSFPNRPELVHFEYRFFTISAGVGIRIGQKP